MPVKDAKQVIPKNERLSLYIAISCETCGPNCCPDEEGIKTRATLVAERTTDKKVSELLP